MKPGIFTRKRLREIVPGLTRTQESQIIDLYLMSREETEEAAGTKLKAPPITGDKSNVSQKVGFYLR